MGKLQSPYDVSGKLDDLACDAFQKRIMESFKLGALSRWALELQYRIIPENLSKVIAAEQLHADGDSNALEVERWTKINALRTELGRDTEKSLSIFSKIKQALVLTTTIPHRTSWSK